LTIIDGSGRVLDAQSDRKQQERESVGDRRIIYWAGGGRDCASPALRITYLCLAMIYLRVLESERCKSIAVGLTFACGNVVLACSG